MVLARIGVFFREGLSKRFICRKRLVAVVATLVCLLMSWGLISISRHDQTPQEIPQNFFVAIDDESHGGEENSDLSANVVARQPIYPPNPNGRPSYASPEVRLANIAADFRRRGLREDLCGALKNGEIVVEKHRRRGGKKVAWIGTYNNQRIVVKKNDFPTDEKVRNDMMSQLDKDEDDFVTRKEFFPSLANGLDRMGMPEAVLDKMFHSADVNKDSKLDESELSTAALSMMNGYNRALAPEALILAEHMNLTIFPRYFGHCKSSYLVEFLPIHSLHMMKAREWPERARLAAELIDWAHAATKAGIYVCDVILGNFGRGKDGLIKINDLDQVHTHEDVSRWDGRSCDPDALRGTQCFNDGHCVLPCNENRVCESFLPHHNYKEICKRLFLKKRFLRDPETHKIRIRRLALICSTDSSTQRVLSAVKDLHALLTKAGTSANNIEPPKFEGQMRNGVLIDRPDEERKDENVAV